MNDNERWWQAYLAKLAGLSALPCEDQCGLEETTIRKLACGAAAGALDDYHNQCGPDSVAHEPAWTGHARVELLGHRSYLGRIREVERYGAHMGEVQELLPSGEYGDVHQFGGKSVYEIRTLTLEAALKELRQNRVRSCAGKYCYAGVIVEWGHPAWSGEDPKAVVLCGKCKAEGQGKATGEGEEKADADLPFDEQGTTEAAQ